MLTYQFLLTNFKSSLKLYFAFSRSLFSIFNGFFIGDIAFNFFRIYMFKKIPSIFYNSSSLQHIVSDFFTVLFKVFISFMMFLLPSTCQPASFCEVINLLALSFKSNLNCPAGNMEVRIYKCFSFAIWHEGWAAYSTHSDAHLPSASLFYHKYLSTKCFSLA